MAKNFMRDYMGLQRIATRLHEIVGDWMGIQRIW